MDKAEAFAGQAGFGAGEVCLAPQMDAARPRQIRRQQRYQLRNLCEALVAPIYLTCQSRDSVELLLKRELCGGHQLVMVTQMLRIVLRGQARQIITEPFLESSSYLPTAGHVLAESDLSLANRLKEPMIHGALAAHRGDAMSAKIVLLLAETILQLAHQRRVGKTLRQGTLHGFHKHPIAMAAHADGKNNGLILKCPGSVQDCQGRFE